MTNSFDCDSCEFDWPLGQPGTCDVENSQCLCDTGFTGIDDSFISNTCHVNISLAFNIHVAMVALAGIGVIVSICCLIQLYRRWKFKILILPTVNSSSMGIRTLRRTESRKKQEMMSQTKQKNGDSTEPSVMEPTYVAFKPKFIVCCGRSKPAKQEDQLFSDVDENEPVDTRTESREKAKPRLAHFSCFKPPHVTYELKQFGLTQSAVRKHWKLKRDSLIICVTCVLFNLMSFGTELPFVLYKGPEDRFTLEFGEPWENLGLSFSTALSISTIYLLLLSWYNTLPPVKAYGSLLKISAFFVRFPKFVYRVVIFHIISIWLAPIIVLVIIPLAVADSYRIITILYVITAVTIPLIFGILQYVVIGNVIKIYKSGIRAFQTPAIGPGSALKTLQRSNIAKVKQLKKAIRTAKSVRYFCTFFAIWSFVLALCWLVVEGRHQFIFYTAYSFPVRIGAIIFPIGILYRTEGGLTPISISEKPALESKQSGKERSPKGSQNKGRSRNKLPRLEKGNEVEDEIEIKNQNQNQNEKSKIKEEIKGNERHEEEEEERISV